MNDPDRIFEPLYDHLRTLEEIRDKLACLGRWLRYLRIMDESREFRKLLGKHLRREI